MDIGGLVHAFFDNAGPGGVVVLVVIGAACVIYYYLTRWIVAVGKDSETVAQSSIPNEEFVSMDA